MLRFACHGCGERLLLLQPLWGSGGDQPGPGRSSDGKGTMSSSGVRVIFFLQWELG